MTQINVGILHPGNMGTSIAASAKNSGCAVYWASDGRSEQTRARADAQGFIDKGAVQALCDSCEVILSVCPPHAAEDVADEVLGFGYQGLYLDGNAISPMRTQTIAAKMTAAGVEFVDGGIIGGPAWQPGTTLYLAGDQAARMAACFSAGPLETSILGDQVGQAAALKMCYAAWSKGTTALLCAILATAKENGIWEALAHRWSRDNTGFDEQAIRRARTVTAKAWRFAGEMEEIAATFADAGLPSGFHGAAADLYRRLAGFKDAPETPTLEAVLDALTSHTTE